MLFGVVQHLNDQASKVSSVEQIHMEQSVMASDKKAPLQKVRRIITEARR